MGIKKVARIIQPPLLFSVKLGRKTKLNERNYLFCIIPAHPKHPTFRPNN